MKMKKQVSLLGLLSGAIALSVLLWLQMQPKLGMIRTTVELRRVYALVEYRWGWPFVYRETWRRVCHDKELDQGRYNENYHELSTKGDLETLRRIFPELDIPGWVRSREDEWERWSWDGQWHATGLVVDVCLMLLLFVAILWVVPSGAEKSNCSVPAHRPSPPPDGE